MSLFILVLSVPLIGEQNAQLGSFFLVHVVRNHVLATLQHASHAPGSYCIFETEEQNPLWLVKLLLVIQLQENT